MSDVLGAGKAIEKLMDPVSGLIKKLAGPAAEEVGLSLQDSVKVWRAKRQYKLFEKMKGFIADAGFEPQPIALKTLLPALDYASVEDDEDLHTAWAALLANAADPRETNRVLPVFPIILRELTSRDARFLDNFYERFHGKDSGPKDALSIFNSIPDLEELYPRDGFFVQPLDELTPEEQSAPGYLDVTLDTLERTNLIAKTYMSSNYPDDPPRDILAPVFHAYVLTGLGMMFVRACRAPRGAA
jgi:hypothetical protein